MSEARVAELEARVKASEALASELEKRALGLTLELGYLRKRCFPPGVATEMVARAMGEGFYLALCDLRDTSHVPAAVFEKSLYFLIKSVNVSAMNAPHLAAGAQSHMLYMDNREQFVEKAKKLLDFWAGRLTVIHDADG